jgi:hypothetical protein
MSLPTNRVIEHAIKTLTLTGTHDKDYYSESFDSVRIAYAWLDAQKTTGKKGCTFLRLKHIIEAWGGRYVSSNDVTTAAYIHHRITGTHPGYNLSNNLTYPCHKRLKSVVEAYTHFHAVRNLDEDYSVIECPPYIARGSHERPKY